MLSQMQDEIKQNGSDSSSSPDTNISRRIECPPSKSPLRYVIYFHIFFKFICIFSPSNSTIWSPSNRPSFPVLPKPFIPKPSRHVPERSKSTTSLNNAVITYVYSYWGGGMAAPVRIGVHSC